MENWAKSTSISKAGQCVKKPLYNLRLPVPSPASFPDFPGGALCSVLYHWWGHLLDSGFVHAKWAKCCSVPHSIPESPAYRTWNPEPKAHMPISDQKKRGPLLWWCRVLLPVGPECSPNKIGISSFLGQHSSEWRWDFSIQPFPGFSSVLQP